MSACLRAFAASRERVVARGAGAFPGGRVLRRLQLALLLIGLSHTAISSAQVPIFAPSQDEAPPAPPEPDLPVAPSPPPTPVPGETPDRDAPSDQHPPIAVRYTLEAIQVHGNTRTERRVVLRYVPFKPGDVFDVDDNEVELSRYRLLGTGFFRDVQFSLKKGSKRGLVVLVIEVTERNTVVINDISMGLAADGRPDGRVRTLSGYAGLDVAETNLAGTGITLGGAMAVASEQLALRVRFLDPAFLGAKWMVSGSLLYNDALDYFGNADVFWTFPEGDRSYDSAVVDYTRFGGSLGVGRDLSVSTQLWLHYRL
jgi:outer membrane protein insertion porin family